jgi:hypothetical protein
MERRRRLIAGVCIAAFALGSVLFTNFQQEQSNNSKAPEPPQAATTQAISPALEALKTLPVKGRAPKTGYTRTQFGNDWQDLGSCDMRNYILARDLDSEVLKSDQDCTILSGTLHDPYTGKVIAFMRGASSSSKVQIDHIVALSDAWQKGAQQLSKEQRFAFANDPLNLLAVDGQANNDKSDGDAATWLPPNKPYRCQYVARQISVKQKYTLWITIAEKEAMQRVLQACPDQVLPLVIPPVE